MSSEVSILRFFLFFFAPSVKCTAVCFIRMFVLSMCMFVSDLVIVCILSFSWEKDDQDQRWSLPDIQKNSLKQPDTFAKSTWAKGHNIRRTHASMVDWVIGVEADKGFVNISKEVLITTLGGSLFDLITALTDFLCCPQSYLFKIQRVPSPSYHINLTPFT